MGKMAARLDVGDQRHLENQERLKAIEATLKQLVAAFDMTKGGFWVLASVGGASAAIGAAVSSLFQFFRHSP